MAGAGIRQNIATQAALTENMQRAGLNLGMTAAQQAGDALLRGTITKCQNIRFS